MSQPAHSRCSRRFLATSLAGALAAPLGADGQQMGQTVRLGYLSPRSGPTHLDEAFRQTLSELGWAEGQNLMIEYRWADGRIERLAHLNVDVIFAGGGARQEGNEDGADRFCHRK